MLASADIQSQGEKTMDVSFGDNMPVILEDSDQRHLAPGVKRVPGRDRRRNRRDRRKEGRDGVVVHLSGKPGERRSARSDRRNLTY